MKKYFIFCLKYKYGLFDVDGWWRKGETMIIECDISYVFGINNGNTILFFANI